MFSNNDLALELEKSLVGGFNVNKISKVAFDIYQEHGLELTPPMDRALLVLMAMEEGKELELNEAEFLELISEIRAM